MCRCPTLGTRLLHVDVAREQDIDVANMLSSYLHKIRFEYREKFSWNVSSGTGVSLYNNI